MQSAHGTYTESNLLLKAFRVFFFVNFRHPVYSNRGQNGNMTS
jgi:hypothetical protein